MRLILFIALAFYSIMAPAQGKAPDSLQTFEGGIIFGANISRLDGDTYDGYHKIGIQVGGQVYIHFFHFLGFSMDLLYAQKGARGGNVKESPYLGTYFDKYYLNLNYVEVPFTLHYHPGFLDYEVGIAYARLVKSVEWASADVPVVIDPSLAYFNKDDYEYVLGLSTRLGRHWYVGMRYQQSIKPVRTWDSVPPRYSQYGVGELNQVFVFRALYML